MAVTYNVRMLLDTPTPMRDGVNLSSYIYLPEGRGPFPTVLIRTPYDNNSDANIMTASPSVGCSTTSVSHRLVAVSN